MNVRESRVEALFHVRSREINKLVRARDQFEAWDTLRDRDIHEFGLIASAETDESDDPIVIHTAALMFSWGRDEDALRLIELAVANDLPDTTEADRESATRIIARRVVG